ncbi:dynamin family protein [Acinetobacter sp. WCHA39]|uniref:dynamin family protein n=1 Tax=Acinetobacter sp. WCHA39 TaxID=2004648 RepID=UPI00148D7A35|nr:dynamin family protein [Acinetobacter sp. WCHA39]
METLLTQGLQARQDKIQDAGQYLQETKRLFQQFGQKELTHVIDKFEAIEKSLDSSGEVKLVVIGEFSRGKSTLINALLNIRLLIAAQESTTAINTFVRQLPQSEQNQFIRIHRQDGYEDIAWEEDDALEKWGTELDETNKGEREKVDFIEVFASGNPLLEQGLVLIDTPGLQSINKHHEAITKRAINEAHIAIWVQSTSQLGGNATEWKFLSDTVQRNFNKFLTVINMWDTVIEPQDHKDQKLSLEQREAQKYQTIKDNFTKNLSHVPAEKIAQMTQDQNLIGVSAIWGLATDDRKEKSNIGKLSARIAEMLSSGEALEEIYKKPLKTLTDVQQNLIASVEEELQQLASDQSLMERQRDSEKLDQEIKNLELELTTTNRMAKGEHDRAADDLIKELEQKLITPLVDLKDDIDVQVTPQYIEREINLAKKNIQLPKQLQQQYDDVAQHITDLMQEHQQHIVTMLADLRADYAQALEKHAGQLQQKVSGIQFELPTLDLNFDLDLSELYHYEAEQAQLEDEISQRQAEIDRLKIEIASNRADPAALEYAYNALKRAEQAKNSLGSRPSPKQVSRTKTVPRWGIFGWAGMTKEVRVTEDDYSNVEAWEQEKQERAQEFSNQKAYIEKLQQAEQDKGRKRMSDEMAQRKFEQDVAKFERKRQQMEQKAQATKQHIIENTYQQLVRNTSGELDKVIRKLKTQVQPNIQYVFNEQLKLLQQQVQEQLAEPLQAKLAQRQHIQALIAQGKEQIEQRQMELQQGLIEVRALLFSTEDALQSSI